MRRSTHDYQLAEPAEYPDPKTTTPEMWAWEFLRRNPNYRKDWERWAALPITKRLALDKRLALASPACILALKYGLCDMMDPSCSSERCAPRWETDEITAYGEYLTTAYGEGNEIVFTRVETSAISTEGRYQLPISTEKVYVPFNLARPIEAQLKRAKRLLGKLEADFKRTHPERSVSKRKRESHYRKYLQLLDAEKAGVEYNLAAAKRLRDGDYRNLLL